jgi:excisionase family DNA binding protein
MSSLPAKDLLRVEEVAAYFEVSERTIYLWVEHGKLEGRKLARNILRITRASVLTCGFRHPNGDGAGGES